MTRTRALDRPLAGVILLVTVLLSSSVATAGIDGQAQAMVRAADLRNTRVALYAEDLDTGEVIISLNPDEPMTPASNMKLLTSAAALDTLGPEFAFQTELRLFNDPAPGGSGTVPPTANPDPAVSLVLKGDGDPGLGDPELMQLAGLDLEDLLQSWVNSVKNAKVTRVRRLLADDRVFDYQMIHPTWPEAQLTHWYCAPVAGLNFNDNCFDVYPEPTRPGQSPIVRVRPGGPFLSPVNRAVTDSVDNFWVTRKPGTNELTYWGKVKSRRTQAASVTMHDPPNVVMQVLAHRLGEAGIVVETFGRVSLDEQLPPGRLLHVTKTPLPLVLARCNKDSQNLFAEALIKRLGFAKTGAPGSWDNGAAAIRLFLANRIGPSAAVVNIADGSGMSRENRVTPRIVVRLLQVMNQTPKVAQMYRDSLSEAGRDGTLRQRLKDLDDAKVYGKTGFIEGVVSMSGYLVASNARPMPVAAGPNARPRAIAFSLLFNNVQAPVQTHQIRTLQDKLVRLMEKELASPQEVTVRQGG